MHMAKRRRDTQSRGATMVEFAIISIALFTLIFGVIEGGFAVRARSSVNNAVDDAARQGAVASTNADADYRIIRHLVERDVQAADVHYVVVYRAENGSSPVPPGCIDGFAQTDVCNVYRPVDGRFNLNRESYGCDGGLGTQWCPRNRASTDNTISFLGVYVRADYEPIINQIFFDYNFSVDATSVQAIETRGEIGP